MVDFAIEDLLRRRERMIDLFERGVVSLIELHRGIVALMLDCPSDDVAIEVSSTLPEARRLEFLNWFSDLAETDYKFRWFGIGDTRTTEQIDADAKSHQAILKRIGPTILKFASPERD